MAEAAGIEAQPLPVLDLLYAGLMLPKAGQEVSLSVFTSIAFASLSGQTRVGASLWAS